MRLRRTRRNLEDTRNGQAKTIGASTQAGIGWGHAVLAFPVEGGVLTPLPYGTDTDWVLILALRLEIARWRPWYMSSGVTLPMASWSRWWL
jgi:hypothetical protein